MRPRREEQRLGQRFQNQGQQGFKEREQSERKASDEDAAATKTKPFGLSAAPSLPYLSKLPIQGQGAVSRAHARMRTEARGGREGPQAASRMPRKKHAAHKRRRRGEGLAKARARPAPCRYTSSLPFGRELGTVKCGISAKMGPKRGTNGARKAAAIEMEKKNSTSNRFEAKRRKQLETHREWPQSRPQRSRRRARWP